MLEQKGKGSATYYVPTAKLLRDQAPGIGVSILGIPQGFPPLPEKLIRALQGIGRRTPAQKIRALIVQLCAMGPLELPELVEILQREADHLRKHYLSKMIDDKDLEYLFPDSPNHPQQAYRSRNLDRIVEF